MQGVLIMRNDTLVVKILFLENLIVEYNMHIGHGQDFSEGFVKRLHCIYSLKFEYLIVFNTPVIPHE